MAKMNYDAVIFDVDGTLWDATKTMADAYSAASEEAARKFRALGIPMDPKQFSGAQIRAELGQPTIEIFRHLYPELEELFTDPMKAEKARQEILDLSIVYEYDYLRRYGAELYDGLTETLMALHEKYPLFIVSNCEKGYIELFTDFSKTGPLFDDWLCYGDTLKEKDRTIRIIMEKHGLQNPVYVGDIEKDALSSRRAGVGFFWASYGFGNVPPELYDEKLHAFTDLKGLLC